MEKNQENLDLSFEAQKNRYFGILDKALQNQAEATTKVAHQQAQLMIDKCIKNLQELYLQEYTF